MLDHLLTLILVLAVVATIGMIVVGLYLFLTAVWSLARDLWTDRLADWRSSRLCKPGAPGSKATPFRFGIPPYAIELQWHGPDELRVTFHPNAQVEDLLGRRSCRAALTGAVVALYPEDQRPYAIGPSEHVVSLPHHWLFVGTAYRLPLGLEPEYIWEASRPGVCTHGSRMA